MSVELRFVSGLSLHGPVARNTTVCDLRRALLKAVGASLCRDEAVVVSGTGQLFEEPWHTPFVDAADGESFQVIVREAQTPYYRDVADRQKPPRGDYN